MNDILNLREYWTLPTKVQNFYFKNDMDDYNEDEDEDEDQWNCDEDGHFPVHNDVFTTCGFCDIKLVRMRKNDETFYVDPKELVKLKKWNEMVSGGER